MDGSPLDEAQVGAIPKFLVLMETLSTVVVERRLCNPVPFACAWLLLNGMGASGPHASPAALSASLWSALAKVLAELTSLADPRAVAPILAALRRPAAGPGPSADPHQASALPRTSSRPSLTRGAEAGHRLGDGIAAPTQLHMALERFFDGAYVPPLGPEGFLHVLPPKLWPPEDTTRLLAAFDAHDPPNSASEALTRDDRLAAFAYTYEARRPARLALRGLEGDALRPPVEALLVRAGLPAFSEAFWGMRRWTGEELCHRNPQLRPAGVHISPGDAATLAQLSLWLYSPGSEQSSPTQLYREMNAAMRSFEASRDAIIPYQPLIYHIQAALARLPAAANAAAADGQPYLIVYRGIDVVVSATLYRPGSTICWPAFSSTSSSVEVAKSFLGGKATGTLFIVEALTARDVSWLSQFP
eukprot:EG_transcript_14678